jgi:membrane protein implicated in regulation of membrane protease activity
MENLKIDFTMFSLMAVVLAIVSAGYFLAPQQFEDKSSLYLCMFLGVVGIVSYFQRGRREFFRNTFLISYFGLIISLIALNSFMIASGKYDSIAVKFIILANLAFCAIYPFYKGKQSKQNSIAQ